MTPLSKQVDRSHDDFQEHMCNALWDSLWHQSEEVMRCHFHVGQSPFHQSFVFDK